MNPPPIVTTTNVNKPSEPVLKIDARAFDKFVYMRDYRPCEVAMFGITHKNNPLHVYDFELVKQEVNSVSADCDKEYMADFVVANLAKGIPPINCERIWCHTHPMTGETSANPSSKDMSTWNDPDNSYKNFLVMMILSKSGQITCKLRIRSNWNKEVTGLDLPFEFEKDIKVEIVKDEAYTNNIKQAIVRIFGEQAVNQLGNDAFKVFAPYMKLIDVYPEFADLHRQYEELVTQEKFNTNKIGFTNQNNHQNTWVGGGVNSNSKKKQRRIADASYVPEMLLIISEHKQVFSPISDLDLKKLQESFAELEDVTDLQFLEDDFFKQNPKKKDKDLASALIGAIAGGILDHEETTGSLHIKFKAGDFEKRAAACNAAGLIYPDFKEAAIEINVARGT